MSFTIETLLATAADLISEDDDNPEYDRAIAELTNDLLGGTQDDKDAVLAVLRHRQHDQHVIGAIRHHVGRPT